MYVELKNAVAVLKPEEACVRMNLTLLECTAEISHDLPEIKLFLTVDLPVIGADRFPLLPKLFYIGWLPLDKKKKKSLK